MARIVNGDREPRKFNEAARPPTGWTQSTGTYRRICAESKSLLGWPNDIEHNGRSRSNREIVSPTIDDCRADVRRQRKKSVYWKLYDGYQQLLDQAFVLGQTMWSLGWLKGEGVSSIYDVDEFEPWITELQETQKQLPDQLTVAEQTLADLEQQLADAQNNFAGNVQSEREKSKANSASEQNQFKANIAAKIKNERALISQRRDELKNLGQVKAKMSLIRTLDVNPLTTRSRCSARVEVAGQVREVVYTVEHTADGELYMETKF